MVCDVGCETNWLQIYGQLIGFANIFRKYLAGHPFTIAE
jgi:hypothetical protein